jgi:hypothetical protein
MGKRGPKPGTIKKSPELIEAMKGNKYAIGNRGPGPFKYTPEFIEKEAEALLEWCKKEDSYYITGFSLERGYSRENLFLWARKNQVFNRAYRIAKETQEYRLFQNSLKNKINPSIAKWGLACNHKWKEPPMEVINTSQSSAQKYLEIQEKENVNGDEPKTETEPPRIECET